MMFSRRTARLLGGGPHPHQLVPEIESLSEEQCRALSDVKAGDLLLIVSTPKPDVHEAPTVTGEGGADQHDATETQEQVHKELDLVEAVAGDSVSGAMEIQQTRNSPSEDVPVDDDLWDRVEGRSTGGDESNAIAHKDTNMHAQSDSLSEFPTLAHPAEFPAEMAPAEQILPPLPESPALPGETNGFERSLSDAETKKTEDTSNISDTCPPLNELAEAIENAEVTRITGIQIEPEALDEYRFNRFGFDRNGYHADGFNEDGWDRKDYGYDGHDRDGYDRDGRDYERFDRDGRNSDGMTREECGCFDSADDQSDDSDYDQRDDNDEITDPSTHADLYVVVVTPEDEYRIVRDLYVQRLEHTDSASIASVKDFQLRGDQINVHADAALGTLFETESLSLLAFKDEVAITLNPSGSDVRNTLQNHGSFSHQCNHGFLYDHRQLQDMVSQDISSLSPFRPLCPVCLGMDLLDEQLRLRALVDVSQLLDITQAVEHVTRRNIALEQCGYGDDDFGEGFDEQEWGFDFNQDDEEMLTRAHVVRDAGGSLWQMPPEEALNVEAVNVVAVTPAATDAIESLQRAVFGEMEVNEKESLCLVCHESLEPNEIVAQMPCSHCFHEQCLEGWLAEKNVCPTCRIALPFAEDNEASIASNAAAETTNEQGQGQGGDGRERGDREGTEGEDEGQMAREGNAGKSYDEQRAEPDISW